MHDVAAHDVGPLLEAEGVQVLAQDSKTARLLVDERHAGRAAGKGFDAERAGAGEKVEHRRAFDARSDHVEDRLLHHPLRRADVLGRLEPSAPCLSPAHAQVAQTRILISPSSRMTPIRSPRVKRRALPGGIATSSPPLVCASHSINCSVSPRPPHSTRSRNAAWLRLLPSGKRSRSARLPTPFMNGTDPKSMSAPPRRFARCPMSPYPVTSVAALARALTICSEASRLRAVITLIASASSSGGQRPRLMAVVASPEPNGLVRNNTSPPAAPSWPMAR